MRKISTIKGLCLVAAFVFASFGAKAQFSRVEASVFLPSFNIPTSDFGSAAVLRPDETSVIPLGCTNMGREGSFGFGFGMRFAYRFDIGFGEVSPFLNGDFYWNRVSSSLREQYDESDLTKPFYINVPIMIGVSYRYQINELITPFIEFGLGPDIMYIGRESYIPLIDTDMEDEQGNHIFTEGEETPLKYKTTINFAGEVGAGTYLGKRVSLGLHYYFLGGHSIKFRNNYSLEESNLTSRGNHRKIQFLAFRIGFHF